MKLEQHIKAEKWVELFRQNRIFEVSGAKRHQNGPE